MQILIVNNAGPGITEFTQPIEGILKQAGILTETICHSECLSLKIEDYSGAILSGSQQGDDIVEHHQPYFQWIKHFNKPVLGICAGHQIVGRMFGAEYMKDKEQETGNVTIEILNDDPIFNGISRKFPAKQMHNHSITMPAQFVHLAKSQICFNQAMRHSEMPLITLQFHPEYLNPEILLNFASMCR